MQNRWRICALVIASVSAVFATRSVETQTASCFVSTINGNIQGADNGSSCTFLGVPFAAPPIGNLRWKPPQPASPWAPATLAANVLRQCPQIFPAGSTTALGNEDCLVLNIWAPHLAPNSLLAGEGRGAESTTARGRPVIVWTHTGAFQGASINFADSNGRRFAEQTGAIVVAANYRLGPFGFLGHPALTAEDPSYPSSGNYGFLDQRAALAWVRDHIAAFGGDPDNVTVAGQSAGAHSVSLHLVSPGSAGYFSRAIIQSGTATSRWPSRQDAESRGTSFAASVGCTDPSQVLACMRGKTRNEVLLALPNGQQEYAETGRAVWGPVVDGLDIPDQPRVLYESGAFSPVPTLIGTTRDEGWIYVDRSFPAGLTVEQYDVAVETEFGAADAPSILAMYPAAAFPSPKHALSQLTGDVEVVCEARRVARFIERTGTPVYLYSFEREVDAVAPDLVIHGLDRNFVFGNNFGPPSNYVLSQEDLALFGSISGYWTRFAAAGNPNGDGTPHWPAFKHPNGRGRGASRYIVLDWPVREGDRLRETQCDFWDGFFLDSIVGSLPASHPLSDLCGANIDAHFRLDHDLACSGNGLIAGADGIRIDLNGHTIAGSGVGAGISLTGRTGVTISGGVVRNFETGVRIADSTDIVIRHNEMIENTDGIDLQAGSYRNSIRHNTFRENRARGIMARGDVVGNVIRENTFTGNRVGILLFGAADTRVRDNVISASVLAGIRFNVLTTGNLVKGNTVTLNPAGIEFLITPTGSSSGNRLVANTIATNTCGLKGPIGSNTLRGNSFSENGTDTCQ
jgi:para-nitrobenzyl esterase